MLYNFEPNCTSETSLRQLRWSISYFGIKAMLNFEFGAKILRANRGSADKLYRKGVTIKKINYLKQ